MMTSVEAVKTITELFSKHCEEVTVMYNEANTYTITFRQDGEPFFISIAKSVFFNLKDLHGIVALTIIKSLDNFNGNGEFTKVLTAVLQDITDAVTKEAEETAQARLVETPRNGIPVVEGQATIGE